MGVTPRLPDLLPKPAAVSTSAASAALTAMEGSLRATFRMTACKKGSGDAPSVAFHYPFAETRGLMGADRPVRAGQQPG